MGIPKLRRDDHNVCSTGSAQEGDFPA